MGKNNQQNANNYLEEAYNTPLGRIIAEYEESLKKPPVGTQETLRTSVAPMYELPKSSSITPMATTPIVPEVEADDALQEMAVENAQPKEYDEDYAKKMVGASLGKLDIKTPEVKGISINPSLSQTENPLDKMLGNVADNRKYVYDTLDEDSVRKGEAQRALFDEYAKQKVGAGNLMSAEDLPSATTIGSGDLEEKVYSFGTETLPKNVVDEYLAAWNNDVLHEKRFKEDAEYRNDWMLRHTGKSERRYREELAGELEARLNAMKKDLQKGKQTSLNTGLGYAAIGAAANKPSSGSALSVEKIDKALEVVNTLRKNNFGAGFAEGFDLGNILTLDLKDFGMNVALIKALNKDTRGEQLNANEKALVEAWSITQDAEEAMEMLGGRSMGANVGYGGAQSLGFITQNVATGGLASAATKGISRAAAKVALKRAMNTAANKGIGSALKYGSLKVAESAVGAAARVPFSGFTYKNYTDKRLNQFQLEERFNEATGKMEKVIGKQETSALRDAVRSALESFFEFQSEDVGGWFDYSVKAFAKALPRTNLLRRIATEGVSGPVKGAIPRLIKDAGKVYSLGGEVLSEAYGDAMVNTLTGDTDGWKQMATADYWWELAGVSAMLSGGFAATNRAANRVTGVTKYRNMLEKARVRALDNIDNEALRKHLIEASSLDDLTERSKMLASLDWGNTLTREDMANAIDFIQAQTKLDVADYSEGEANRLARMVPSLEKLSVAARDGEISYSELQENVSRAYVNAFRVQENQEDLARIYDRVRLAAEVGVSANDINNIISEAGLTIYNVGDDVETLSGVKGIVNRVLPAAYEVIDEKGNIGLFQFEEVLQPSPEVREAQLATTEQTEIAEAQAEPTQQDVADKAVAEAVETARAEADKIKNKDDEKVYTAKLEDGTEGYIIKGEGLEIGSDGRIVKSDVGTVIFKPTEGKETSISINEVKVTDVTSVEDYLRLAADAAKGMAQGIAEAQQSETQYPEDAAYIATDDGSRKIYVLKGQDIVYDKENGEIKSPHVVKVRIDGGEPIDFPAEDLMIDEEIAPTQQAEQAQPTEENSATEAPTEVAQPTQSVVQEASTETQAPAIPTLKNGRPDYNAMSPEMFAEQYTAAYGAEKTVKLAQANIADADKVIADLEKKQDSLIDPNKIDEVQVKLEEAKARKARYEAVLNIMNTPKAEPIATEAQSEVAEVETQPTEEVQPQVEEAQTPEVEAVEDPKQGLRQRIAAWEDKLGVPVKVIERVEDIENAKAREAIESGVNITGWYDKNTGEVYFYLPNVVDTQEVDSTIVHEIVAHKGLEQMLGKETFGALCDRVWDMMSENDRNTFLAYPGVNGDYRKAADEYIAYLAERTDLTAAETTIWQEIVNFIREAIAKIASDVQLTNEDIEDLIRASYRNLAAHRLEAQGAQVDVDKGDVLFAVKDVLSGKGREKAIKDIMAVTGRSREEVEKYLKAEESLAKVILDGDNVAFLDLQVDESVPSIWKNSDYPQGTVEFSNICRKRLPFTMIYQRLQKEFPNTVFDASTLETIRGVLKDNGVDVACGLCFVEDRRQLLGEIGQEFIDAVRGNHTTTNENQISALEALRASGDTYIPNLYELITLEGMKELRQSHPEVAAAFIRYNKARGMQAGRLFQAYSAYHREIRKFNKARVKRINDNGGLRIFSFSDFEAHHLIDLVQVLTDCASKGIKVQGYTKVPEFARAVKNTKMKVNRSLIAKDKGYVEDGYVPKKNEAVSPNVIGGKRLLLDTVEGINVNDENFFDSTNSTSIGNILVGINDEQIRLAMADPFVDYIIPFHTGIKKATLEQKGIGDWVNYKNYQVEKVMGANGKLKKAPTHINIYTDVLSDDITNEKQFVKRYLEVCREKGYVPKFPQFLKTNAKGEYVYTKGYYKFLIDFKLFDKSGRILPQEAVVPVFDNAFNKQILNKYVADEKAKAPNEEVYAEVKEALGLEDVSFRVVYHGSAADFDKFDKKFAGSGEGQAVMGAGHYVTTSEGTGRYYAETASNMRRKVVQEGGYTYNGEVVRSRYLVDAYETLKRNNFDVDKAIEDVERGIAAIRRVKGESANTTSAEERLKLLKEEKATPEQWLKMIEKNGGLKAGEDKWLRLSDWLKDSENKTLTKQEVLDYINENQIQIEEVKYAEENSMVKTIKESPEFAALRKEYFDLKAEIKDEAETKLREKYGPDFDIAFSVFGDLFVKDDKAAAKLLGIPYENADLPIQGSRLMYSTQGITNKREIALTVPTIEPWNEGDQIHFGDAGEGRAVAWIRFGETTDSDGKRVLVIDEIQSKRHQEGRERGYRVSDVDKYLKDNNVEVVETGEFYEFYRDGELDRRFSKGLLHYNIKEAKNLYVAGYNKSDVPAAPFEKNWHELAMKRMLRYAAENGYDAIAWTKGDQQAERYNIGSVVQRITSYEDGDNRMVIIRLNNNEPLNLKVDSEGKIVSSNREIGANTLSDVVGKELAVKIMNNEGEDATYYDGRDIPAKVIAGEGLRIGGEGMRGFYDQILPSFMNKYGKKWGVKVQDVTLPFVEEAGRTMHSVDVTDAMRESVMEGQPMFRVGDIEVQEDTATEVDIDTTAFIESEKTQKALRRLNKVVRQFRAKMNKVSRENIDWQKSVADALEKEVGEGQLRAFLEMSDFVSGIRSAISEKSVEKALEALEDKILTKLIAERKQQLKQLLGVEVQRTTPAGIPIAHGVDNATRQVVDTFNIVKKLGVEKAREYMAEISDDYMPVPLKAEVLQLHALWSMIQDEETHLEVLQQKYNRAREESVAWYHVAKELKDVKGREKEREEALAMRRTHLAERRRIEPIMTSTKQQTAEDYASLVEMFADRIMIGRDAQKRKINAEREYARRFSIEALKDVTTGRKRKTYERSRKEKQSKKKWERMRDIRLSMHGSLKYAIESVSINAIGGRGFIYKEMIEGDNGWIACRDNELNMNVECGKSLLERAKNAGFKSVDDMRRAFDDALMTRNGEHAIVTYKTERTGRQSEENVALTVGNSTYLVLMWNQPDIRATLEKMNIDEGKVMELYDMLPKYAKDFISWSVDMLEERLEKVYNPASVQMYGTSMDKNLNYFPVRRVKEDTYHAPIDISDPNVGNEETQKVTNTSTALIRRKPNLVSVEILVNPLEVMGEHLEEMNHFAAFVPFSRNANILLSADGFREQLEEQSGTGHGLNTYDNFKQAVLVAAGNYQPKTTRIDSVMREMQGLVAVGKIAWRFFTALKQLLSLPAFISYSTDPKYWAIFTKAILTSANWKRGESGRMSTWKWCYENLPTYKERWDSKYAGDEKLSNIEAMAIARALDRSMAGRAVRDFFGKYGMLANASVDAFTCSIGAYAIYEYELQRLQKEEGLTKEDAEKMAKRRAEIGFNQSQQSSEKMFLAPTQLDRTFAATYASLFENSNRAYGRIERVAREQIARSFDKEAVAKQLDLATRRYAKKMRDAERARLKAENEKIADFHQRLTDEQIEEEVNKKRGEFDRKARMMANADMKRAKKNAISDVVVFRYMLNTLWAISPSLAMSVAFIGSDDDDENPESWDWKFWAMRVLQAHLRNGVGGATIEAVLNGFGVHSMLETDLNKIVDAVSEAVSNSFDAKAVDWQAFGVTAKLMFSIGLGVNIDTFINMYNSVCMVINDGSLDAEDVLTFLNAPKNVIEMSAIRPDEGESQEDYIRRIAFMKDLAEDVEEAQRKQELNKKGIIEDLTDADKSALTNLKKWQKNYIDVKTARALNLKWERNRMKGRVDIPELKELEERYSNMLDTLGLTPSLKMKDKEKRYVYSPEVQRRINDAKARLEVMKRLRNIRGLEKGRELNIVKNDDYEALTRQWYEAKKSLVDDWNNIKIK